MAMAYFLKFNDASFERYTGERCGKGDLLSSLGPSEEVGVDFSQEMIEEARKRHLNLRFVCADVYSLDIGEFDYVVMSDLLNDVWNVQDVLTEILPLCHSETKLIFNFFSHRDRSATLRQRTGPSTERGRQYRSHTRQDTGHGRRR
jgi:ubiquinone/menaquinone biosynthesis C-methylase UbiE